MRGTNKQQLKRLNKTFLNPLHASYEPLKLPLAVAAVVKVLDPELNLPFIHI